MHHNPQMFLFPFSRGGYLLLAAAAAVAVLGCNGQAMDGNTDAGVATGGSATAGSHSGGSAGAAGSPDGGGTSSGGATSECSMFEDDHGWAVAVSIINRSTRTIHVGQQEVTCSQAPLFQVADRMGDVLADFGSCRAACEAVMDDGTLGCPAICAFPSAVTLQPDEGTNLIWNGMYRQETSLPQGCFPTDRPVANSMCDRAVQIAPGRFTFTAQAGTELDCLQTTGSCLECMAQGDGGCSTPATIVGTLLSAQVTVELDASYGVGGGDQPDGVTGIGSTVPVEIVFTD